MAKKSKIKIGDTVYWTDPDGGFSSGKYKVTAVPELDEDDEEYDDDMFSISNGTSEAEVLRHEIKKVK